MHQREGQALKAATHPKRPAGEAIWGTQRYSAKHFLAETCFAPPERRFQIHNDTLQSILLLDMCSLLRRAIWGTQLYIANHLSNEKCVRASSEAILGTQRCVTHFLTRNVFAPPARRFWVHNNASQCMFLLHPPEPILDLSWFARGLTCHGGARARAEEASHSFGSGKLCRNIFPSRWQACAVNYATALRRGLT